MKNITIINAYGDHNIGDAAILSVGLKFINEAYNYKCSISVLCESTKSLSKFISLPDNVSLFQHPYGYAIRGKSVVNSITKITRFIYIYLNSYLLIILNKYIHINLPEKGFFSYISQIKNADKIVGMGGGYLLTKDKIKDYFGLMLSLISIYIAKYYKKKIVFYPNSFGPFASNLQEKITYNALKNTTFLARDMVTLKQLHSIDKNNLLIVSYAPDLGLFYPQLKVAPKAKAKSKYIVLTAREWFSDKFKQAKFENSLVRFVKAIYKLYKLKTVFVSMGKNPIEDDDNRLAVRIKNKIDEENIFTIKKITEIRDLQLILKNAKAAVCTRMHSAILSCTVGTPFVAIGYGHKTLGFMNSFDLQRWLIDINNVNFENLLAKFSELIKPANSSQFNKIVSKKLQEIEIYEQKIKELILL